MVQENKKNPKDTTVIACHCYQDDVEEFKKLCREQGKFHSEVLRELILDFNKQNRKPQKDDIFDDIDTEEQTKKKTIKVSY